MAQDIDISLEEPVTKLINSWALHGDLKSANQLRSIIYYHLKGVVKKQFAKRSAISAASGSIENLPNTTSFLHDVLLKLTPPKEIYENREQYFVSLASFVRWMLLDEIKSKKAKKRTPDHELLTNLLLPDDNVELYLSLDNALNKLSSRSPRAYKAAMLHYFLGYQVNDIEAELNIKKSTAYNELSTAKAFLRVQCAG